MPTSRIQKLRDLHPFSQSFLTRAKVATSYRLRKFLGRVEDEEEDDDGEQHQRLAVSPRPRAGRERRWQKKGLKKKKTITVEFLGSCFVPGILFF